MPRLSRVAGLRGEVGQAELAMYLSYVELKDVDIEV